MRPTTERILTTHAGSLPRPPALVELMHAAEAGDAVDDATLADQVKAAVGETVRNEISAGVDIVNDGEVSKPSYATYIKDRLAGMGGTFVDDAHAEKVTDLDEFPDFTEMQEQALEVTEKVRHAACDGPLSYTGHEALQADIDELKAAIGDASPAGVFMSSVSPGTATLFSPNEYYPSDDAYLEALAEAMRVEYEAIHRAGILLQLDCPDFAWASVAQRGSVEDFIKQLERRIEVLNHAVRNIPAQDMRVHVCWGNGEWPRTDDIPLKDIIRTIFKAKPAGIMVMGANGRHSHEWRVFEDVKLPDGRYLLPGVIDTASNVVEHPEAVADRIEQYARLVGRENVTAATDCGFSTMVGMKVVAPTVVWAKLRALADGARLASERLWSTR